MGQASGPTALLRLPLLAAGGSARGSFPLRHLEFPVVLDLYRRDQAIHDVYALPDRIIRRLFGV